MDFRKKFEEYIKLTIATIEMVQNDKNVTDIIFRKNNILEEIKKEEFNEEELREIIKELNVEKIENELVLTIKKEMVNTKRKIDNINQSKMIRQSYRNSEYQFTLFRGKA